MKFKFTLLLFLLASMFIACDDTKEEIDTVEPEEISLEVNIPEIELKRGIIPINVKVSGTDSTRILLDGVKVFESIDAEYEFNLNTEEYNDGIYTLSIIAGKSEETKFEQEIEIFNKLMTYELLDEELDKTDQENRWRIIVLTTLDGDFLDYKIMESAGIYEFERPDGFQEDEFMLYFFRKNVSFSRTNFTCNAFDIKIGKWGTSPLSTDVNPNSDFKEQAIQLTDFGNETTSTNLRILSREDGLISSESSGTAISNTEWNVSKFPVDFSFLDTFLYSNRSNAADLFHAKFNEDQLGANNVFEISRNDFTLVEPSTIVELPNNIGFNYVTRLTLDHVESQIIDFRELSSSETLKSYDLGLYYENYEHDLNVFLNDEENSSLRYIFRNENMPTQLPPINFSFDNVQLKSDEVSFSNSGDEGLINILFLNRIDRDTILRVFIDKNYNKNISVKLPDLPQEIIEFEPLFSQYRNNTYVGITISNEPVFNTSFKVFQSIHGRTNELNFESSYTRSLNISPSIN